MITVQEIHESFFNQQDLILQESQERLNNLPVTRDPRVKKLTQLGFVSAKPTVDDNLLPVRIHRERETIDIVNYYRTRYPHYRLISSDKVIELCKKYNLMFANVKRYKGDIPSHNIDEIININVKDEDWHHTEETVAISTGLHPSYPKGTVISMAASYEIYDRIYVRVEWRGSNDYFDFFISETKVSKDPLMIVAPAHDLDLTNTSVENHKVSDKPVPLDPIVLCPVKHNNYYLIISAWGEEANDPNVVNANKN